MMMLKKKLINFSVMQVFWHKMKDTFKSIFIYINNRGYYNLGIDLLKSSNIINR